MCCVSDGDECGCCAPSTCGVVLQLCSLPIEESNNDITFNEVDFDIYLRKVKSIGVKLNKNESNIDI